MSKSPADTTSRRGGGSPHKSGRRRAFHHNGLRTLTLSQLGVPHEDGWLKEYRDRRGAWAAAARERLLREGWTRDEAGRWHAPALAEEGVR